VCACLGAEDELRHVGPSTSQTLCSTLSQQIEEARHPMPGGSLILRLRPLFGVLTSPCVSDLRIVSVESEQNME
jgi:hypothetical protein